MCIRDRLQAAEDDFHGQNFNISYDHVSFAYQTTLPGPDGKPIIDVYKRQLSEINDGRGIVFATGTPISNTMCEMYVMQLYLRCV